MDTTTSAAAAVIDDLKKVVEGINLILGSVVGSGYKNVEKAREALTKVAGALDKADKTMSILYDVPALGSIFRASKALLPPGAIQKDRFAASLEFGQLFGGLGRFAEKTPFLREYAPLITQCGGKFFFNSLKGVTKEGLVGSQADYDSTRR
jgi:hypothetical protein